MIVDGFRYQPRSPHKKGCIGAIAEPEVMVASRFRNLFERRSFVAGGKARQFQCAFGALYSPLEVTSKENGCLTPISSASTRVSLSGSWISSA